MPRPSFGDTTSTKRALYGVRFFALLGLLAVMVTPVSATSIGITVTRGTTVALPEHGLVPVRVYTNEGRGAFGVLHPSGTVTWFTYPDGGPEVGDRLITAWTRTALAGGDVLLTSGTSVKVANTRAQWAGEVP